MKQGDEERPGVSDRARAASVASAFFIADAKELNPDVRTLRTWLESRSHGPSMESVSIVPARWAMKDADPAAALGRLVAPSRPSSP
jgi:hypothetical protein